MVRKKKPSIFYITFALIFSAAIFFSGIGIGLLINSLKADTLSANIQNTADEIKDTEIELLLFNVMKGNLSCEYLVSKSYDLGEQAASLGERLEIFENFNDINSENYVNLKKDYMRVLMKNWLTLEEIKKVCPSNYTILLYFYNSPESCSDCRSQGFILSYYKNLLGQDLMVFSFDSSLNMSIVNSLETIYGVKIYPSIVVNNKVYGGFINSSHLGEIISYDSNS